MSNPDNRAALLQFGLNMLTPMAPGQNIFGHIAQGVGQAGETVAARQTQRTEQAQDTFNRALNVARLGQGSERLDLARQQQDELREHRAAQLGIDEQRLGIEQQRADTGQFAAETRRMFPSGGGAVTDRTILSERSRAYRAWLSAVQDYEEDQQLGGYLGTPNPGNFADEFWPRWAESVGLDPNALPATTFQSGDAHQTGADLQAGPPTAGPTPKPSVRDYLQSRGEQWSTILQLLKSPDVGDRQRGQAAVDMVKQLLADPENLPGLTGDVPAPPEVPTAPPPAPAPQPQEPPSLFHLLPGAP